MSSKMESSSGGALPSRSLKAAFIVRDERRRGFPPTPRSRSAHLSRRAPGAATIALIIHRRPSESRAAALRLASQAGSRQRAAGRQQEAHPPAADAAAASSTDDEISPAAARGGPSAAGGGGRPPAAAPQRVRRGAGKRSVEEMLSEKGWKFDRQGKHIVYKRAVPLGEGRVRTQTFTRSCTPSDWRVTRNQIKDLIHMDQEAILWQQLLAIDEG